MFERDLSLPEEGAMCVDSNPQAAKYLMVQLMNRINKDMNTWWKFNVATDRKGKLDNWKKGFRPDVTGPNYPVKEIDPITGEPQALKPLEYLQRLQSIKGYARVFEAGGEPHGNSCIRGLQVHSQE